MKRSLELRQERSALYDQAQQLIPAKGAMSSENREKFDRCMADMELMKADIDRLEKVEALSQEMQAPIAPNGGGTAAQRGANPGSYFEAPSGDEEAVKAARQKEYKRSFGTYLRRGLNGMSQPDINILRSQGMSSEYRDQDNTSGPGGAYTIPTGFQRELEVALKAFGGMRTAARSLTTATGANLPWPTTNDTTVMGTRLGQNAVVNPATLASQTFGQVTFGAYTYTSGLIRIPNELMNDSAFDLEGEVRDRFAERIGRIQNNEFTLFTGAGGPTGVVNVAHVAVTGATGETTSCTYDDVINLQHGIDPAYRPGAAYMFHDSTLSFLRRLKDSYGRPLFGPGLNGGDPDTIAGYSYVINQDFPAMAASAKSMAFGQWSKYVIRDVANSAAVMRLSELYATQNETAFLAFLRSDGQLLDAGTHPIALFQNSAT